MIKKIMFYLVFIGLLLGCSKTKTTTDVPQDPVIEQQNEEVDDAIQENDAEQEILEVAKEKPEIIVPNVPLGFLVTYEGKYATQEKLFENEVLASRLKALKRFNYQVLIQNYNTETSLVIKDNIVHMSGCKQHNCPSSAYDFFIDLDKDNINVFYFRNNMLRVYQEKGLIDLPPEFAKDLDTKKSNAGIGNPDSIESKYEL